MAGNQNKRFCGTNQLAHVIFEHYHYDYNKAFPEWPLDPALADYQRIPATGSPYTDTANWNGLVPRR